MTLLDTFLDTSVSIIEEHGTPVVVAVPIASSYNPQTGINLQTFVNYNLTISPPEPSKKEYIVNDVIQMGILETYFAAKGLPFTPVVGMKLTLDGEVWVAVTLEKFYYKSTIVLYGIQLQK